MCSSIGGGRCGGVGLQTRRLCAPELGVGIIRERRGSTTSFSTSTHLATKRKTQPEAPPLSVSWQRRDPRGTTAAAAVAAQQSANYSSSSTAVGPT